MSSISTCRSMPRITSTASAAPAAPAREGRAFTIATPEDGRFVDAIEKLIGNEIPKVSIEGLPDLELDLNAAPRRGRGPKRETKSTEGRPERKPREPRGERAPRVERQPSEEQPALEERPAREERAPRAERQPRAERAPREERPREDRQPREERQPREDRQPREERPVRDEQRPVRDDRNFRRERGGRGRRDEFGIGEMTHGDHVIGFGAHMPDFMMVEVTFPPPLEKKPRGKSPTEDEIEGDDDDLEIEAVANTPEEVFAEIEAEFCSRLRGRDCFRAFRNRFGRALFRSLTGSGPCRRFSCRSRRSWAEPMKWPTPPFKPNGCPRSIPSRANMI